MNDNEMNRTVNDWLVAIGIVLSIVLSLTLGMTWQTMAMGLGIPSEQSAIQSLKQIASAQALFRESDKETDGILDYASNLTELGPDGASLIDGVLATGKKGGYLFTLSGGIYTYTCDAVPLTPPVPTILRTFYVDESAVIRFGNPTPPNQGFGVARCQ